MSVKRRKYYIVVSLFSLLIVLSAVFIFILKSEAVSRYLVSRLSDSTHNALTVDRVRGSLLAGFNLHAIAFKNNQQRLFVEHAEIQVSPFDILRGKLLFRRARVTGVTCKLSEFGQLFDQNTLDPLLNASLPFTVVADDVSLDGVLIHLGDRQYNLEQIRIKAVLDEGVLFLKRFEVEEKTLHFYVTGNAGFTPPYPYQAELRWVKQNNNNRLRGKCDFQGNGHLLKFQHRLYEPWNVGLGGEVNLSRVSPAVYQLGFTGDLHGQNIPPTRMRLSGQFSPRRFDVETLAVNSLGGEINVSGNVHWQSPLQWNLNIDGAAIDPGEQWALWHGTLDVAAAVSGRLKAGEPDIHINNIHVAGDLLDQPFRTTGDLFVKDRGIRIANLNVRSGKNTVALDGTASQDSNLRFEFDVPQPAKLWTGIYGHFRGKGVVTGDLRTPIATISLDGSDMRYGEYHLKTVAASAEIDLKDASRSHGRSRLGDFRVSDQYFSDITVDWTGDFKKHRVRTTVVSPSTSMELGFKGSSIKDDFSLTVDTASFDLQQHGRWQLLNPVDVLILPDEIKPFSTCWVQEEANICLEGSWSDVGGWKKSGDVAAPAVVYTLAVLKDLLNKDHLGWDTHNNK
jgi:hypothetical protein